jgi:hypothetical protein
MKELGNVTGRGTRLQAQRRDGVLCRTTIFPQDRFTSAEKRSLTIAFWGSAVRAPTKTNGRIESARETNPIAINSA